jgi:lipid-A-disaccharide synthase
VYKTHPLTYFFYKRVVIISHISLVNLLVDQSVIPELIQDQLTKENLHTVLLKLLWETDAAEQKKAYKNIKKLLGKKDAAKEAAKTILRRINLTSSILNGRKKKG